MSAECEAYVEKHSPYSGNYYLIHMRLATLANETNDYKLWIGDAKLCDVCRCSPKTIQRVRNQMIADGFLVMITPAKGRENAVYQLLMPDRIGGHSVLNRWSLCPTPPIYINKKKKSETSVSQPPPVDISLYEQMRSERSENGAERARQLREIAMGNLRESSG